MNRTKLFWIIFSAIFSLLIIFIILSITNFEIENIFDKKKNIDLVDVTNPNSIFQIIVEKNDLIVTSDGISTKKGLIKLKSEFKEKYDDVKYTKEQNAVVVYPIFTEAAYNENGFYDYFEGTCDESCLTVPIQYNFDGGYGASDNGYQVLSLLGYQIITDIDIDKNPEILDMYDKVILLHNEYVTQKEFDAIISHENVIYLYPNSLYAKISVNYELETISLVKGHSYPDGTDNGFNWEFDNTRPYEFDKDCINWEFYRIDNGHMLNCYPENFITESWDLLKALKEI